MPSKSETFYDKWQLITFHHVKKKLYTEIAKIVQLNRNTVASIAQQYKKENRFELKKRSGPKLITRCEKRIIIHKIKNNSELSAPKLNAKYYKETKKKFLHKLYAELYERKGLMVGSLERNLSSTKLTENEY